MDLSDASFHRLLDRVYEAAEHPSRWSALYEHLCEAVEATSIHMLAVDKQRGALSYSDGANLPVQGELAYMHRYHAIDPRLPMILARPVHAWLHCHEELDEAFVENDRFYQEFLLPYDRRYLSATKLVDAGDSTVIFCTLRSPSQGPLAAPALAFLDRLLPHMSRACRLGLQNFVYSTQALVGHMMVDKLRQPVVLVSPGGEVMHTNEAAAQLLRSTRMLRIDGGRLQLPPAHAAEFLRRCEDLERGIRSLQGAQDTSAPVGSGQFQSMHMSWCDPVSGRQESLYAFFSLLLPQASLGVFGLRPVVMLLFYHPDSAPEIDSDLLFTVFGLTPAESRVASLLAQGLTLKEIAGQHGIKHDTVRKQLRAIYEKTATNRQHDLIRLLLNLPQNAVQT